MCVKRSSNSCANASPRPSFTVSLATTDTLPIVPPRRTTLLGTTSGAAHEPARAGARLASVAHHGLAADDRRGVAVGGLQEPSCTAREVVDHLGTMQDEAVEVDHVDVGLLTRLERAAVTEPVQRRGVYRHLADHHFQWDTRATPSVAHPVREHVRLDARVTDGTDVRAAVAEAERGRG